MIATGTSQGGGGGSPLPVHPVRPPRLPDLPALQVPGGAHCQCRDEWDAGRLVAPGVRQQSRWQAHRSVPHCPGDSDVDDVTQVQGHCRDIFTSFILAQVQTSRISVRSLASPSAPAPAPWTPPPSRTSGRSPFWTRWSGFSIRKSLGSSSTRKTSSPYGPWRSWTLMQRKRLFILLSASFFLWSLYRKHMIVFLCIDYTIWPGWNHRGVYLYSREQEFKVEKIFLIRFLMYAAYFPFIQLNFLSLMATLNV